jgi:3-oxoacyl-[acyl-carrier protein] reductase
VEPEGVSVERDFKGKVAVVTGSSKGIGKAVARQIGLAGAQVVINARSADAVADAEEELRAEGCDVFGVALNVAHEGGAEELVSKAAERFGPVGLLVNMVAINPYMGPLLSVEAAAFSKIMLVNTWTAVAVVQAGVRHGLIEQKGAVVNVSTVGARQYQPELAPYCASKAALEILTTHLAHELGPHGVRVNTVSPGLVKTDMAQTLWEGDSGRFEEAVLPLRRIGQPGDIASAVTFLLSDEASWITGCNINVDGGRLITSLTYPSAAPV